MPLVQFLIQLLVLIVVLALVLWIVETLIPLDPKFRQVIRVILALIVLLWLLGAIGVLPGLKVGANPGERRVASYLQSLVGSAGSEGIAWRSGES